MYWPRTQTKEETQIMLHFTPCSCLPLSFETVLTCHRKRRSNKPSQAIGTIPEKDRQAMSFLEQKVEDLKLMVPGEVRRYLEFSLCNGANSPKDDADLAYGRYEPVYTEMELLDIYQDLLSTQVQAPEMMEPAADELEEQANDRALVHSLISRLNENSPPEPGTSQSHATDVDPQGPVTRYRQTVSRLAAILQGSDTTTEHPDASSSVPSSESKAVQQVLPSPLEWAAFVRECVSTLRHESACPDHFLQIRMNDGESAAVSLALIKVCCLLVLS